jgi:asparagine synthase (glutamine-hydrolysing)
VDFDEPLRWLAGLFEQAAGPPAARAMRVDFQSYLPYDLHTKVDIAAMACSLECRAPFVDPALVEFALSLPLEWRLGRCGAAAPGGRSGKRILRDWAAELLPPEILRRRKMGFGVPVGEWFRNELRGELETRVLAADALSARVFRPDWLRGLVADHLCGRANHEHALWALLMLELWRRRWQPAGW